MSYEVQCAVVQAQGSSSVVDWSRLGLVVTSCHPAPSLSQPKHSRKSQTGADMAQWTYLPPFCLNDTLCSAV